MVRFVKVCRVEHEIELDGDEAEALLAEYRQHGFDGNAAEWFYGTEGEYRWAELEMGPYMDEVTIPDPAQERIRKQYGLSPRS